MSQTDLAKAMNLENPETRGQSRISNYERGNREPSYEMLQAIAEALDISVADLLENKLTLVEDGKRRIPLLRWDQVADYETALADEEIDHLDVDTDCGHPDCFALQVQGDAMTSPRGLPTYPEGCHVLVNPGLPPVVGRRVVALQEGHPVLRTYAREGVDYLLLPLNQSYPVIPVTGQVRIIGPVVATLMMQDG